MKFINAEQARQMRINEVRNKRQLELIENMIAFAASRDNRVALEYVPDIDVQIELSKRNFSLRLDSTEQGALINFTISW